jgi:5'(3')-deoxyribonucleotidase
MNKYLTRQELEKMCSEVENIALDIDDCVIDSLQADVTILNKRYNKNVDKSEIKCWNFNCHFDTTPDEIEDIFNSQEFFDIVQFKPNAKEFILSHKDKVFLVTKGNELNLLRKRIWLIENGLQDIKYIGVPLNESKGVHIPYDSVFIDDNKGNLESADCKYKVMFETNEFSEWQRNWQGLRVKEW